MNHRPSSPLRYWMAARGLDGQVAAEALQKYLATRGETYSRVYLVHILIARRHPSWSLARLLSDYTKGEITVDLLKDCPLRVKKAA